MLSLNLRPDHYMFLLTVSQTVMEAHFFLEHVSSRVRRLIVEVDEERQFCAGAIT
jgi:hypothetical protein